jgi:hypothetical protein
MNKIPSSAVKCQAVGPVLSRFASFYTRNCVSCSMSVLWILWSNQGVTERVPFGHGPLFPTWNWQQSLFQSHFFRFEKIVWNEKAVLDFLGFFHRLAKNTPINFRFDHKQQSYITFHISRGCVMASCINNCISAMLIRDASLPRIQTPTWIFSSRTRHSYVSRFLCHIRL